MAIKTEPFIGNLKEMDLTTGKKLRPLRQRYPIDYFVIPINFIEKFKNSPFLKLINTTGMLLYMDKDSIDEWISDAKIDYEQSV